jgi:hypothetical protein
MYKSEYNNQYNKEYYGILRNACIFEIVLK